MREDEKNVEPKQDPAHSHEALKFYFTPVDEPYDDAPENPHAKSTTQVQDVIEALREQFGEETILEADTYAGEYTVFVEKSEIRTVCRYLKDEEGFNYLSDLGGIDQFQETDRYEVFYNLVAMDRNKRIRLKVRVDEEDLTVPSINEVFRAANWNERECYDMLGIHFEGHPDLRRMYMPEDFEYHPLRKEFPILGVPGSLPLPPQTPEGDLTMDPFAAAHGDKPVKSYQEPKPAEEE